MTVSEGEAHGWRARWVGRENERRRTAYDAALQAWRRRDEELRQLYCAAEEPVRPAETPAGLPVRLDDDEVVLAVQPAAEIVEATARHTPDLPTAELTVVPVEDTRRSRRRSKGARVVDAGMAVVTDRRLIVVGRDEQQEWPYARLAGVAHHPEEPFTLLHPDGPGRIRGVWVPRAAASTFRLLLTVAYADATGARAALLDRLDDAVMAHWLDQPPTPSPATPADAPLTARLVRPALVAAVAVALAIAAVVSVVHGSVPDRPVIGMDVDRGTGVDPTDRGLPPSSTGLGTPARSAVPHTTGTTSGQLPGAAPVTAATTSAAPTPTADPSPAQPSPQPTETTSSPPAPSGTPSPTEVDRCGAPANPYGYNYCGGSYIYDPAPDVCTWFDCVENLWSGKGYLVQCKDGLISRTGMQRGPCSGHDGTRRPVYI
ncbi:hypothetical protein [Micromonospora sp. CB01531]|uniref:hypothetical protein n=1 Tax=Micromonospora sp. CB01531 TaxID=1718947 RepID=UPI00095DBC49|nr:hypothetical protein [Micromonospora sp. CB01531]OKI44716.1 hypothetical protein A6A27_38355 [Micromonospora sp. CB01531]